MSELKVNKVTPRSGTTVTLGDSGDTIALASGASVTGNGLVGITMADQWRLTTELTGNQTTIDSNLERVDDASWGGIGTGMTESSGIFSFPSTGTYLVIFNANCQRGYNDSIINFFIEATTNNSSYDSVSVAFNNSSTITGGFNNVETKTIINVTDTSNVKVKFAVTSATSGASNHIIHGNSAYSSTSFTFIRLGDST